MKLQTSLTAALIALGIISQASATQYVYISGSTAARNAAYATLNSTAVFDSAPSVVTQGNAAAAKANYMTFSNTIAGTPTVIKCEWSGSEAGVSDLAGIPATESFLDDSAVTVLSSSQPGP